ncbi:DUF6480 family protein [Williamsia sp. MIQD14]|uniref:DUF6480 family protein n=1 Tax=Williamsia sp. MIQD14 TaxID=3425703 RepID=UPI003DA11C11
MSDTEPARRPDSDLQDGGGVDPGATPPAYESTSLGSDKRQETPRRFSPTTVVVLVITTIIVIVAIAGLIAVIVDSTQYF